MDNQIILANYNEIDQATQVVGGPQSPVQKWARSLKHRAWVQGLHRAGLRLDVYRNRYKIHDRDVRFDFVPDRSPARNYLYLPFEMHRQIAALAGARKNPRFAVLVHVNGLLFPLQVGLLRCAHRPAIPILTHQQQAVSVYRKLAAA